jgi:catechol 2,3-dioxygenase-like lactoylglutathione lyase family enzyme
MSGGDRRDATDVEVECIVPILRVTSLRASLKFYREVLGFRLDWGDDEGSDFASVSRGGHAIMLCQGAQGQLGTWIWIGVDDVEPLFAEYRSKGVQFLQTPTNRPWAYEMQLVDPDGHVLRFGSEPRDTPSGPGGP